MCANSHLVAVFFQNWVTFAPIANRASEVFDVSLDAINMLAIVYMIVSIPVGFLVCWLLDAMGLVIGVSLSILIIGLVHLMLVAWLAIAKKVSLHLRHCTM